MGKRYTIEDLNILAQSKGGKFVSKRQGMAITKYTWECAKGHKWKSTYRDIINGHWCRKCYLESVKPSIKNIQKLAQEKGGKLLSKRYINNHTKLLWECKKKHKWKAIIQSIQAGQWCPECSSGVGERITRAYFEQIFKYKFKRIRPNWMRNLEGQKLELDGYCKELNIAFEHQGMQHYEKKKHFYKTNENFKKRLRDDKLKKKICKKEGVVLFDIPEVPHLTKISKLKTLIKEICIENKVEIPNGYDDIEVDLSDCYYSEDELTELQLLANERGGKLLSKNFKGWAESLNWECSKKHRFKKKPREVKYNKGWCWTCTIENRRKKTYIQKYKELEDAVKLKKGKVLSDAYLGSLKKLLFECNKGHQWESTPSNIARTKQWCPYCSKKVKGTIEEMQAYAKSRGGVCLSKKYISRNEHLKWKCSEGHIWESTANTIVTHNSWCRKCYRARGKK